MARKTPQPAQLTGLHGKVALVTGGAQRIGREIALQLAREGADVAITYLDSARSARKTTAEIRRLGARALALRCDVTRERQVRAAVARVVRELGGLDVLVNNAAIYETVAFDRITLRQWERALHTNLLGPYLVTQAALSALRARRGRVINLGSLGGIIPWTSHAHYCASKAGLHHLSRIMAKALAPTVAVNCVAPGMIETDSNMRRARLLSDRLAARSPMGSNGKPADVAAAVLFFATAPRFITGQVLVVAGGLDLV